MSEFHVGQFNFLHQDEYARAVREVLDSGWYTNHGPQAKALEQELASLLSVKHCVLVGNATLGLAIAMEAAGPCARIVMPGVSFPATLWAAQFLDSPTVLVDVNDVTGHVHIEALEAVIQEGDLLVIPNLYGGACSVADVERIAGEHNCRVVFDSAGSLGTRYNERLLGSFGDCEVFSLHATKIVGAGEGGFVATNNDEIAERVRSMRSSYGNPSPVPVSRTANARFGELPAACARRSVRQLDHFMSHNHAVLDMYEGILGRENDLLMRLKLSNGVETNGSSCTYVLREGAGIDTQEWVDALVNKGVIARRYYRPGLHKLPASRRLDVSSGPLPGADSFLSRVIQFPVGGLISEANAEWIAELALEELHHLVH